MQPTTSTPESLRGRLAATPLTPLVGALALHGAVMVQVWWNRGLSFETQLARWDALHYADVAAHGYTPGLWAFFPLWPASMAAVGRPLSAITGLALTTSGALLALGLFGVGVWALARRAASSASEVLRADSPWGWFFFAFSPASWVFHSAHTEALFLVVSVLALRAASEGRAWQAGVFAGLAALTRNQGVFVALACVGWLAVCPGDRLRQVLKVGLSSGAAFAAWLVYQAVMTGSPLAFLEAQRAWPHATGVGDVFRALTFTNPKQPATFVNVVDFALFWVLVWLTWRVWRRSRPLGAYAALSLAVIPLQSETTNVARFATVLFPLWWELGRVVERWPRPARWCLAAFVVWLNAWFCQRVMKGHWAY